MNRVYTIATAAMLAWCVSTYAQEKATSDIVIKKVFGTELPGKYKHPASFTELDNGAFYVSYYGGGGEYETDACVWGATLKKGEEKWSQPEKIADSPFISEGNPVVWQAPDGVLWLYYNQRYGDTWSDTRIFAKISNDRGKTWTDPILVAGEKGMMVRGRPIVLHDGNHLLPIYHETGHDRENVGADTTSLFLRYKPGGFEWIETNRVKSRTGNLQPAPVQLTDSHLIAYCRRGGGYDPIKDGYIVRTESLDGGHTWSEGKDTKIPNPNAAVDLIKLSNGHLVLVYNDNMNDRDPLTISISTDSEQTWPFKRNIAEGPHDYAYPVALQSKDGKIHILFTQDGRSTIMHAVMDESAILSHKASN